MFAGDELCFDRLMSGTSDNYVCSPASVAHAFRLAAEGVQPGTAARDEVLAFAGPVSKTPIPNMATSLWCRKRITAEFLAKVDSVFPLTTAAAVNAWVAGVTHGKIAKILESLSSDTVALLVNAVHFKDTWLTPFERMDEPMAFTSATGAVTYVPGMTLERSGCLAAQTAWGVAARLPYKGGAHAWFVMGDTPLTAAAWRDVTSHAVRRKVNVQSPVFTLEADTDLKDVAQRFGVNAVFGAGGADWTPMVGPCLDASTMFIDGAIHKALIAVDEVGTEAAAATAIVFANECCMRASPESVVHIVLNKPFYFVVTNEDAIVFAARVTSM
jgi:serine protease inhibitor